MYNAQSQCTYIYYINILHRVFKAAGSSSDLVEHDGLEFHTSIDSGLHSCDTDSPMFGK